MRSYADLTFEWNGGEGEGQGAQELVSRPSDKRSHGLARDTSLMETLLALADGLPRQSLTSGETLLAEGTRPGRLFVLLEGALRIEKGGVPITSISEPGACVGEVSLLLDVPATADVVASEPATVAVVDDAARVLAAHPSLSLALAQLLATQRATHDDVPRRPATPVRRPRRRARHGRRGARQPDAPARRTRGRSSARSATPNPSTEASRGANDTSPTPSADDQRERGGSSVSITDVRRDSGPVRARR